MDPLHQKLKALKPDEPDEEIAKDLVAIRQSRPGIRDEEILAQAEKLVQGGGPQGVKPRPVDPGESAAPSSMAPAVPAGPVSALPAIPAPDLPEDDLNKPESFGHKAATIALQGLAGLGDAISGAYGGQKTDFLKGAMGAQERADERETRKREAVAESIRNKKKDDRSDELFDLRKKEVEAAMKTAGLKKQLPSDKVMQVTEGAAVSRMLPTIRTLIREKKALFGPITGAARSVNPYDAEAQATDAQMRAVSQAFGRFLEGGVLRKEDEEKYRKMFPKLGDLDTTAAQKLDVVENLLMQKYQDTVTALDSSGFDTSGLIKLKSSKESPEGKPATSAKKVKVSNGTETLFVDPSDVPEAEKDGFKVVK